MTNYYAEPGVPEGRLDRHEKAAEAIMRRHLYGHMGVISHNVWSNLRAEIAQLMRRKTKGRKAK